MKESEYRKHPAESYSSLKYILESPQAFLYNKQNPFKGSSATLLGTCVHHYLQGNRHLVTFSIVDKRKKEEYAKFEKEFMDMAGEEGLIVPLSLEAKINEIMKNANANPKVAAALDNAVFEEPYFYEYDDIQFKGKMDAVLPLPPIGPKPISEIKTSSQATTALEFQREAYDRDYDMQAYMYQLFVNGPMLSTMNKHVFIVANTTPPYKVDVYKASNKFLLSGRGKFIKAVDRYKRYIINGEPYNDSEHLEEI